MTVRNIIGTNVHNTGLCSINLFTLGSKTALVSPNMYYCKASVFHYEGIESLFQKNILGQSRTFHISDISLLVSCNVNV